jgi:hypothetical protein
LGDERSRCGAKRSEGGQDDCELHRCSC